MIMVNAQSTPKAGWEVKTLGEVCEFARGLTYKKTDEVDHSSNAVLRANNVSLETKSLNFDKIKFIHEDIEIPESKKVRNGSLLICTASGSKKHLGKVALIDADYAYAFGGFMGLLTPHENISSKYFFYSLTGKEYENFIAELSDGANINNLKFSQLQEFRITVPPLAEQERIVGILDEAFEGIAAATAQAEKNLHNARELFQSVLQSTFSQKGDDWVETTLGELGKVSMCKRILKHQTATKGDIPFYKIGTFGKTPNAFISKEIYDEFRDKYSFPEKGEILISASGTIGRRVIYDGEPAYFQDSNIVWIANNENLILNSFLYYFYDICEWNPSRGATISRLYNDDLRKIKISFPANREKQLELVAVFKNLEIYCKKLETIYERKQAALSELKQSLLQKAFAGEL